MKHRKLFLLLILGACFSLASCGGNNNFAEEISHKLVPNLGSLLTQLFAFIVLILLVILFGYKPIKAMLKKRSDHIEETILDTERKNAEANTKLNQANEVVIASNLRAEEIINAAKEDALAERERIIAEAHEEALKMKQDAELEIAQRVKDAQDEIRKEIISVALDASSVVIKRNITSKDNEELINDFIDDLNS